MIVQRPHRARLGDVDDLARRLPRGPYSGVAVAVQQGLGPVLIGGERRYAAQVRRGDTTVCASVIETYEQWLAWLATDHEFAGRYGSTAWDLVDAAYLDLKVRALVPFGRLDNPTRVIAEYAGLDYEKLRATRYLAQIAEGSPEQQVRDFAKDRLGEIVTGQFGPSSALDRTRTEARRLDAVAAGTASLPAAEQRKRIANVAKLLVGMTDALSDLGDLGDELSPEECADWAATYGDARRTFEQTIKKLRERITRG